MRRLLADGLDPARLIPISRSGAAVWYGTPQGIELYGMRDAQAIRLETRRRIQTTGSNKAQAVTAFDRAIWADVAQTLGLGRRYLTLHPAWMFQRLWPFWAGLRGVAWLAPQVAWSPWPAPPLPDGLVLPAQFVAAKFYWRATFPAGPSTLSYVQATYDQIATKVPVIVLDTPFHVDDHLDCPVPTHPNVLRLSQLYPGLTLETGLAVQSAVLARAIGFVGTYGGLSHLALCFQRPNLSVFEQWIGAALPHRYLCEGLGLAWRTPSQIVSLQDRRLLQEALPPLASPPTTALHGLDTSRPNPDTRPDPSPSPPEVASGVR